MLTTDPEFWDTLYATIRQKRADEVELIAQGRCASPEPGKVAASYANWTGFIRALDWVLETAHDIEVPPPPPDDAEDLNS